MKKISLMVLGIYLVLYSGLYALDKVALRTQCRYLLNDIDGQRWTDAVLNERIEMAQLAIVRDSKCLQGTTYYYIYSATKTYTLPSDLLLPFRVSYQISTTTGTYQKLNRSTFEGLDVVEGLTWQQKAPGQPSRYYIWADQIGLVPPASSSYAGANKLRFDYVVSPSSMSTDTSVPFNGQTKLYSYHEFIVWRVCMMCKADEHAYTEVSMYKDWYETGLSRMTKDIQVEAWNPDIKLGN